MIDEDVWPKWPEEPKPDIKLVWVPPYKTKPVAWKSTKTGNEYPYESYCNHGYGGVKTHRFKDKDGSTVERDYMDLPADEYPYTLVYEDPMSLKPAWLE